ncbi:MAG: metabolite traffic protein EboE [Phycisphaeraceae bacterium]
MPNPRDCSAILGYCTNVHAGVTFDETLANLERHAVAVRQRFSPDEPMGVGLWLSAAAARRVLDDGRVDELRDWLDAHGLFVFTLNGFPFGDFHEPRVKHRVYEPDWADPRRLAYTLDLARILAALLPEHGEGSISTLPIGWPAMMDSHDGKRDAAKQLLDLVHHLARLELDTGRLIHVDLEPEPGCVLGTSEQAVAYFHKHLLGHADDASVKSYLRICHDICHAAVMFEDQGEALRRYDDAGLLVGKVQVSSALRITFDEMTPRDRDAALRMLRGFAEDRYLHQTCVRDGTGVVRFFEDLPEALASVGGGEARGEWRVHFHVPIYLDSFALIGTTRSAIEACLPEALARGVRAFEAETYAWPVLPAALRVDDLADGIARELAWLRAQVVGP